MKIPCHAVIVIMALCVFLSALSIPADAQAPAAAAASAPPVASASDRITAGATIVVRMADSVSSRDAKLGDTVGFTVTESAQSAGGSQVSIPEGTMAYGKVVDIRKASFFGRPGRISVSCDFIRFPDGRRIALKPGGLNAAGASRVPFAIVTGTLVGLATTIVVTIDIAISNLNFFGNSSSNSNTGGATSYIAGLAAGGVTSAIWRGGNAALSAGRELTVTVASEDAVPGTAAPASSGPAN